MAGKNYVNNNRGVFLKAHEKKKGGRNTTMEACFYGAGCTRPGCIYRHDRAALASNPPQSEEPCMAYLAGYCAFNAKSCRKRHPPPTEAERLRQKYRNIRCRYGAQCQTEGCLYRHEALTEPVALSWTVQSTPPTAPPLIAPPTAVPGTSWRPTPPTAPPPQRPVPPSVVPSSSQVYLSSQHHRPTPPATPPVPPSCRPVATPFPRPVPPTVPPQPPQSTLHATTTPTTTQSTPSNHPSSSSFNIHAKEFVPGGGM